MGLTVNFSVPSFHKLRLTVLQKTAIFILSAFVNFFTADFILITGWNNTACVH